MKQQGYIINETGSLPVGLWRMTPFRGALARGMIVSICPLNTAPFLEAYERGYLSKGRCASGLEPLLKLVAAIPGDEVEITPAGMLVNGVLLPNSARLSEDGKGRPMPQIPYRKFIVEAGKLWLIATQTQRSFDSRYFGSLSVTAIEALAEPTLIRDGKRGE